MQGVDIIKRRTKEVLTLFTIITIMIFTVFFRGILENRTLPGPNSRELSRIIFINVVDYIGVEKIVIDEQQDIENVLELLKTAERDKDKESISDFPDKAKFTTILFGFESGGNSVRSMYEENNDLYIDQPYNYVYKLEVDNRELLEKIINSGSKKEDISVNLKEILRGDF